MAEELYCLERRIKEMRAGASKSSLRDTIKGFIVRDVISVI